MLTDSSYIGKYKLYRKNIYIDNYIPASIQDALHGLNASAESVSKFVICCDAAEMRSFSPAALSQTLYNTEVHNAF